MSGWPTSGPQQAACRAYRSPRQRLPSLCELALGRAQRARVGAGRVRRRRRARGGLAAARGRPAALVPLLQLQRLRRQALLRARSSISGLQAGSAAQRGHSLAQTLALRAARAWCTEVERGRHAAASGAKLHGSGTLDPFHGKPRIRSTAKATHTFQSHLSQEEGAPCRSAPYRAAARPSRGTPRRARRSPPARRAPPRSAAAHAGRLRSINHRASVRQTVHTVGTVSRRHVHQHISATGRTPVCGRCGVAGAGGPQHTTSDSTSARPAGAPGRSGRTPACR
jgi:hypothetical protein